MKTGDCYRADHLLEGALEGLLEDAKNPPGAEAAKARALSCRCCGVATCSCCAAWARGGDGAAAAQLQPRGALASPRPALPLTSPSCSREAPWPRPAPPSL